MSDFKSTYNPNFGAHDLTLGTYEPEADETMGTAIAHSLFSDARVTEEELERFGFGAGDPLPDRGGWWFSTYMQEFFDLESPENYGSKLWLLKRQVVTLEIVEKARQWAEEALQWLIDKGIAASVSVSAERFRPGAGTDGVALAVTVTRSDGGTFNRRYDALWRIS